MEKSIIIKKGQETNPLSVLSELMDEVKPLFETKRLNNIEGDFFGATKTTANESYKITLNIKKL